MGFAVWRGLVERIEAHAARSNVAGIVVTHGTDTLEETAYLLHRVLKTRRPVVLTAAMRPATSLQADGPQNLLDAVMVAGWPGSAGVSVAFGSRLFAGHEIRKLHGYRIDAFSAGDAGPLGLIEEGTLRRLRDCRSGTRLPRRGWQAMRRRRSRSSPAMPARAAP
jgi:L-asparaginase